MPGFAAAVPVALALCAGLMTGPSPAPAAASPAADCRAGPAGCYDLYTYGYTLGLHPFTEPDAVSELADGTAFEVAGLTFEALHAPGHTPGSTMLRTAYPGAEVESVVFSGDVLFAGSVGRTDLPGGSHLDMLSSLRTKVLPLPDRVAVLPGHGPQTTIAAERAQNPYLQASYLQAPNAGQE